MPLSDKARVRLARDLERAVTRAAPDWTGSNAHDPGVTMLELLAFTVGDLLHRRATLSPHARLLARDLADRASALAASADDAANADDCVSGLRRTRYFAGQLLGIDDLQTDQDYLRGRLDRRNRLLHGAGIVEGLGVTAQNGAGGASVVIAPGLAFAPDGREIALGEPCVLSIPASAPASTLLVQLAYREMPCRNIATTSSPEPTRIVETFAATLAVVTDANALSIARVRRARGRWRVDASFEPQRVRG